MFPRRFRVPGPRLAAFPGKTIARSPYFIAKAAFNHELYPRFAVVVGKTVDSRSARRHAIKRRIAESIESPAGRDIGSYDIVIIVLPAARNILLNDIAPEFKKFFTAAVPLLRS